MRTRIDTRWGFAILAAVIVAAPLIFRLAVGMPVLPDGLPYDAITKTEHLLEWTFVNEHAHTREILYFTPYHYLLAALSFIPLTVLSSILPLVLAATTVLLAGRIHPGEHLPLFLALTPAIITGSILLPGQVFALILLMAGYILLREGNWWSLPAFAFASLFSVAHAGIAIVLILFLRYGGVSRRISLLGLLVATVAALVAPLHSGHWFPSLAAESFFSDFGGFFGHSAFLILLALIGVFYSWSRKKEHAPLYMLAAALVGAIVIDQPLLIILSLPIAYFADRAFTRLKTSNWSMESLKRLTILIILLGIIFSTVTTVRQVALMEPHSNDALEWLAEEPAGVVATAPLPAYRVEALTDQRLMATPRQVRSDAQLESDLEELFYTRNLLTAKHLLRRHDVEYLLITTRMKGETVWEEPSEGLLFLLRNNETFKKAYSDATTTVWQVR